ncbi:MAG: hypothetical protein A2Y17_12925 [Clostridiales bacterium GWF2_38_85]|nr:MAG: hypothetical protein A2Y17_12925 [Clostridiales bacterium GWF2_38_85]HBL84162.1 hypothetical protein [Clostridiales bacterium]
MMDSMKFNMKSCIDKIIDDLGITHQLCGCNYIKFCIMYILENDAEASLTKEIYPACAKYYNCSIESVDRSIRFCIKRNWIYGNSSKQAEIFDGYVNYESAYPSSNIFINIIAQYVYRIMIYNV